MYNFLRIHRKIGVKKLKNESKKFKILIPVCGFGKSGGYRVLSELANNWINKGHEVAFICFYVSDLPYYPVQADIIWLNISGEKVARNIDVKVKANFKKVI